MKREGVIFLGLFFLLGQLSLVGTSLALWTKVALAMAFGLSFFLYFLSRLLEEVFRQDFNGLLLLIFLLCCLYYHFFTYSRGHYTYIIFYLLLLSALFCYWDWAMHLYCLSSFSLMMISSFQGQSPFFWFGFMALMVLAMARHHDFLQKKNNFFSSQKKCPPGWKVPLLFSGLTFLLFWGLYSSTHSLVAWLDSRIASQLPPVVAQKPPKDGKGPDSSPGPGKPSLDSPGRPSKILLPPLGSRPRLKFGQDLRFGDVDIDKIEVRTLLEVYITMADLRKILRHYRGLFWRAMALDRYAKGSWYLSAQKIKALNGTTLFLAPSPKKFYTTQVSFEFNLSPSLSPHIFTMGLLQVIATGPLWKDGQGNFFAQKQYEMPLRYSIVTNLPHLVRTSKWTVPKDRTSYLTLPEKFRRDYVRLAQKAILPKKFRRKYGRLIRRVRRFSPGPYAMARSIESYLRSHYKYALKPNISHGKDPTHEFLFRTKTGYCQHFASAMVFLLRALNIPSRIVIGFKGGNWNEDQYRLDVTNLHGHAWVEVLFNPVGWYPFDPTGSDSAKLKEKIKAKVDQASKGPMAQPEDTKTIPWENPESKPSSGSETPGSAPPEIGGLAPEPATPGKENPPPNSQPKPSPQPGKNPPEPKPPKEPNTPPDSATTPPDTSPVPPNQPSENQGTKPSQSGQTPSDPKNSSTEGDPAKQPLKNTRPKTGNKTSKKKPSPLAFWLALSTHILFLGLLLILFGLRKKIFSFLKLLLSDLWKLWKGEEEEKESEHNKNILPPGPLLKWFRKKKGPLTSRKRVIQAFSSLSDHLKKAGLQRHPSETPSEYGAILRGEIPSRLQAIGQLTRLFVKARYSSQTVTEEDGLSAERFARRILEAFRRKEGK